MKQPQEPVLQINKHYFRKFFLKPSVDLHLKARAFEIVVSS